MQSSHPEHNSKKVKKILDNMQTTVFQKHTREGPLNVVVLPGNEKC